MQPHEAGFVADASASTSYDCVSFAYADLDACAAALTPPLTASDVHWLNASTCAPAPIRADAVQKAGAAGLTGEVHFLTTWSDAALTSADVRRAFVAEYGDASSSAHPSNAADAMETSALPGTSEGPATAAETGGELAEATSGDTAPRPPSSRSPG